VKKSQNQDLRTNPAWSIKSGKIESSLGDFLGIKRLTAVPSSFGLKGPEILLHSGVETFHRLDGCLLIILVDSRHGVLCAPFFTCCGAIEFAQMGHTHEERPDLPGTSLMLLHALRLECEKSMELTASSHCSCFFCSIRESRDKAALSESVPVGVWRKER